MLEAIGAGALNDEETPELWDEWLVFKSKGAKKCWQPANTGKVNEHNLFEPCEKSASF